MSSVGIDTRGAGTAAVPEITDSYWTRHEHPGWCDPRVCGSRHDLAIHHSEPVRTTASMDCAGITVGMVRVDVDVPGPVVRGETQIQVCLHDARADAGVWLDADGARALAKALDAVADRVDQERNAAG